MSTFANPISIASKSTLCPPSTTIGLLWPPTSPLFSIAASCAYPSWPNRDFLSCTTAAASSPYNNSNGGRSGPASSFVSDADLLGLAQLDLYGDMRVVPPPTTIISWESIKQPEPVKLCNGGEGKVQGKKRRRRDARLKSKRTVSEGLSTIVEAPE